MTDKAKAWWCSKCGEYVDGHNVTYKEQHDERCGGCGGYVLPDKPQSDKTDYVELMREYLGSFRTYLKFNEVYHLTLYSKWLNERMKDERES